MANNQAEDLGEINDIDLKPQLEVDTTEADEVEIEPPLEVVITEAGPRLRPQFIPLPVTPPEETARHLALGFLLIFGLAYLGFILWLAIAHFKGDNDLADALNVAKVLLPYIATPLGVVLGFYFSVRSRQ